MVKVAISTIRLAHAVVESGLMRTIRYKMHLSTETGGTTLVKTFSGMLDGSSKFKRFSEDTGHA